MGVLATSGAVKQPDSIHPGDVMLFNALRLAIAAGLLAASGQVATAQNATVEDIHVQLFYEYSGALSDDLTKRKSLSLWNTMIGEGSSKEPANSFLVSVVVKGAPES